MKLSIDVVIKRIYPFNIVAWNYRNKIGFPVCKKESFAGLQAHRKRGKSGRASPTPHLTWNEERSARFTAQSLSALIPTVLKCVACCTFLTGCIMASRTTILISAPEYLPQQTVINTLTTVTNTICSNWPPPPSQINCLINVPSNYDVKFVSEAPSNKRLLSNRRPLWQSLQNTRELAKKNKIIQFIHFLAWLPMVCALHLVHSQVEKTQNN